MSQKSCQNFGYFRPHRAILPKLANNGLKNWPANIYTKLLLATILRTICSSYLISSRWWAETTTSSESCSSPRSLQLCRRIGNVRDSSGSKRRRIAEQTRQVGDLSSFPFLHLDLRQRQVIVLHVLIIVMMLCVLFFQLYKNLWCACVVFWGGECWNGDLERSVMIAPQWGDLMYYAAFQYYAPSHSFNIYKAWNMPGWVKYSIYILVHFFYLSMFLSFLRFMLYPSRFSCKR